MLKDFSNSNRKGIGDCKIAGRETVLKLENTLEAQKIADIFYKEFDLTVKPKICLTGRRTKRLQGKAYHQTGEIILHEPGANVGVLIHELAHFEKKSSSRSKVGDHHGYTFKLAQTEMLLHWRNNLEKNFVTLNESETTRIAKKAADERKNIFTQDNRDKFKVGQKVWFLHKNKKIIGRVTRLNRETARITPENDNYYRFWRVGYYHIHTFQTTPVVKPEIKPEVNDTEEEIVDMIQGLMEGLSKYAVWDSLSMSGIVKCFFVNGIKNTDENRKIAINYIKDELGLKIR